LAGGKVYGRGCDIPVRNNPDSVRTLQAWVETPRHRRAALRCQGTSMYPRWIDGKITVISAAATAAAIEIAESGVEAAARTPIF